MTANSTNKAFGRTAAMVAALALGAAFPATVAAQQIGREGWQPPPRSSSLPSQFQFQKKHGGGSAGGMSALTQYVTNYNSSSTSIGNYTEVVQNLGEGATGSVTQSAVQDSSGTQDSVANTHDNMTTNDSNKAIVSGKGKGDKDASVINAAPTQSNQQ
jgi:hypothetical protein